MENNHALGEALAPKDSKKNAVVVDLKNGYENKTSPYARTSRAILRLNKVFELVMPG